MRMRLVASALVPIALSMATFDRLLAQEYPNKDINIVVGYSAGSGPDLVARYFAEAIRERSGKNVIVDNRPGALTNIAVQRVAKSKPDGYTVLITSGNSSWAINGAIFKELPFDPINDFTPVTSLITTPFAIAVAEGSKLQSIADLTSFLKSKNGLAKYGYPNSISFACAELYKHVAGVVATAVPYKSILDTHSALSNGEIDFFVTDLTFRKGKLLSLTTQQRSSVAVGVPSAQEEGLSDFDLFAWFGVWVPKNTPADVVEKLTEWVSKSVKTQKTKDYFSKLGMEPWVDVSGEKLREFTRAEMVKWKKVADIAKIPAPQ